MKGMMTKEIILGAWKQQVFQKNRAWVENENIRGEAELMARWMNNWDSRWLALLHGNVGTGKTTLMRALLGLKRLSGGSISFNELKSDRIGYLA